MDKWSKRPKESGYKHGGDFFQQTGEGDLKRREHLDVERKNRYNIEQTNCNDSFYYLKNHNVMSMVVVGR